MTLFVIGFFFPFFYIQLDAVKHGLSESFSFYAVRCPLIPYSATSDLVITAGDRECLQLLRPSRAWPRCQQARRYEHPHHLGIHMRSSYPLYDSAR